MLLVVRVGRTPREALRVVMTRLEQVRARMIGAILNDVKTGSARYGRYYGNYYSNSYYTYGQAEYGEQKQGAGLLNRLKSFWPS
jgi:Mrp family chromosome partitioning ATPase